jgi:hypothetical protein
MEGNTALGASSPANPALHIPDPLSITKAATSSSSMFLFTIKMNNPVDVLKKGVSENQIDALFLYAVSKISHQNDNQIRQCGVVLIMQRYALLQIYIVLTVGSTETGTCQNFMSN